MEFGATENSGATGIFGANAIAGTKILASIFGANSNAGGLLIAGWGYFLLCFQMFCYVLLCRQLEGGENHRKTMKNHRKTFQNLIFYYFLQFFTVFPMFSYVFLLIPFWGLIGNHSKT